jgi:hypothetical protein
VIAVQTISFNVSPEFPSRERFLEMKCRTMFPSGRAKIAPPIPRGRMVWRYNSVPFNVAADTSNFLLCASFPATKQRAAAFASSSVKELPTKCRILRQLVCLGCL